MNKDQVLDLVKEWVQDNCHYFSGFCGAHLMGALNYLSKDTPFPPYRDVDINIVLKNIQTQDPWDISYKGLILECGRVTIDRYRSPEVVLSDPELASNLAVNSILSDPNGILGKLHKIVAKEYSKQKWVFARCAAEKKRVFQGLEGLNQASSPIEGLIHFHLFIEGLTGLVAVASLKPPTHRRCLILMRQVLTEIGKEELEEEMLKILGFAQLKQKDVENYLLECTEAFDKAVEVIKTPVPGGFKLKPHVKPYLVEGTKEMIDEGYHREAMYWILVYLIISNGAIQVDAPEEVKSTFQDRTNRFLFDIGWRTQHDVTMHHLQANILADEIFKVTDKIVKSPPEITD